MRCARWRKFPFLEEAYNNRTIMTITHKSMKHKGIKSQKRFYQLSSTGLLLMVLLATLSTTSCNKRCQCIRYDGGIDEYSTEDVNALGKSCSEMIYFQGLATQRYSVCDWKY